MPTTFVGGDVSWEEFQQAPLVSGETDPIVPRLTEVPVRIPLPGPAYSGSIYEKQRGLKHSYFSGAGTM